MYIPYLRTVNSTDAYKNAYIRKIISHVKMNVLGLWKINALIARISLAEVVKRNIQYIGLKLQEPRLLKLTPFGATLRQFSKMTYCHLVFRCSYMSHFYYVSHFST